jgi:hypothetical protein
MRYSLGTRHLDGVLSLLLAWWQTWLEHESPHAPAEWIGLTCRPHPPAHASTGPRAVALDPYQWSGVVGNSTTLPVALGAGFGSAFALLLVIGIVMSLRNRRAARAVDAAPGLRTLLVGE